MPNTPSARQQIIYDTWKNKDSNIVIEAVAGSGKTTVLLELLGLCDDYTLFLAFNKSVRAEIQKQIEAKGLIYGESLTIHSLGYSAVRNVCPNVTLNNRKYYSYSAALENMNSGIYSKLKKGDKFKLSTTLTNLNNMYRIYLCETFDDALQHAVSHALPMIDRKIVPVHQLRQLFDQFTALREDSYESDEMEIDFIDMIYLPVHKDLELPTNHKYLMIDEAQDLSGIHHAMIEKIFKQGKCKRWVAVGDSNQAIYGFSGSLSNSFEAFKIKDNVEELPLDICYRCPKTVLDEANKVYDVMVPFKTYNGEVGVVDSPKDVKDNSMVICRNSEPLLQLYFDLLINRKSAYIYGNDIEDRLINFIGTNRFDTVFKLIVKASREVKDLDGKTDIFSRTRIRNLKENIRLLTILIDKKFISTSDKCDKVAIQVKGLFQPKDDAIMLCTIHKAKGLESDVVYILNEHLIPSEYATTDEALVQEENLRYVARTRAKEEMYYLNIDYDEPKKKRGPQKTINKIANG
jgi:DNA helicase II / ATP-dependent DNA helicase PcrA